MTDEEAKEWIDDNMSGGGSWSDAQGLVALVTRSVTDERARIVAELRFIEASDRTVKGLPTTTAMIAKRFADDIEAGLPLRGSS